ncbi:MAG: hypothetical protein DME98_08355 [Verrucomicrobia bacterium]|nr:MAG: hypothetical protein DME98_08355 [Verrucomicrobiota bacterium]
MTIFVFRVASVAFSFLKSRRSRIAVNVRNSVWRVAGFNVIPSCSRGRVIRCALIAANLGFNGCTTGE